MADVPKLLGGRYEVGELLGRGGMAEVHQGYDSRLGRQVAIKMLRSELARDHTFLARFSREAQSAAGLNHASIVAVYDHGEDAIIQAGGATVKVPYIVMELVDGLTLREVLTERGQIEPVEAMKLTEGVLDALAYSHRMGIVHRDIKPANVMITSDGSVKVMDFGIARAMADANATMTQTQAVVGTAQYLSPEQAQGHSVDARSDLYSAGCMLFELLTGRPPFLGDSPVSIAYQHVGEQPQPPSRFAEAVSEDLDAVVLHSLAKSREARYQDANQFRSDLQAVRLGRPISEAARGSAATLAGAAALGAVGAAAGTSAASATEQMTSLDAQGEPTSAYGVAPTGGGTDTFPAIGAEEEKAKRGPVAYILLTIAAIAALGLLVFGVSTYFNSEPPPPKVSVPLVINDPEGTAVAKLARVKLTSESTPLESATVPSGQVISQDPEAGTEVERGFSVKLVVSTGPTAISVPDLRGKTLEEATSQLEDLGLSVGTTEKVNDPNAEKGQVIDSNPGAGSSVAPDSSVNLRVGTGKVEVPNVVGKSQNEALGLLAEANLTVETDYKKTATVPEDRIIEQDPASGTVEIGSTVKILVAQKEAPTPTPPPTSTTPTPSPSPSPSESPSPSASASP